MDERREGAALVESIPAISEELLLLRHMIELVDGVVDEGVAPGVAPRGLE